MKKILGLLALMFTMCLVLPAMADAGEKLPDGFIAISDTRMNWADAKAWCQQKGGRLPLINGAASLSWDQIINSGTAKIDGFGQINTGPKYEAWTTPWPSGLPSSIYWTGTVYSDNADRSWRVHDADGVVVVSGNFRSNTYRVFCVR